MDIENWVCELLSNIEDAAEKNENYDLHLEAVYVKEIAEELKHISSLELS